MTRHPQIYEGKAKILYATDDPDVLLAYFKDDATDVVGWIFDDRYRLGNKYITPANYGVWMFTAT